MKNNLIDKLLSLKEQELQALRKITEGYVARTQYLYEKVSEFARPAFEIESGSLEIRSELKKFELLIDEPLKSEMQRLFDKGNGKISDTERYYEIFKREGESSSVDLVGHFFPEEYGIRTATEVICTAAYCMHSYYFVGLPSPLHAVLSNKGENLDLGIVVLKRPMAKDLYEPSVAYNVHLKVHKGEDDEIKRIHISNSEFPCLFESNDHCLISQ